MKHFVICENDCLVEGMTKTEIISAIAEATGYVPSEEEQAFINQIINQNNGGGIRFWLGTRAEYNVIYEKDENTIYHIIDDKTANEAYNVALQAAADVQELDKKWTDNNKALKSIRRKVLCLSGGVRTLYKAIDNIYKKTGCQVTTADTTNQYVVFRCGNGNSAFNIRLNYKSGDASQYEIYTLRGFFFKRGSLYTGSATEYPTIRSKELIRFEVDGVQYSDFTILETVGFNFEHLVLNYRVKYDNDYVYTTLIVNSTGFKVIETSTNTEAVPLRTDFVESTDTGSAIKPIYKHDNVMVFTIGDTNKSTFEKVEFNGKTVTKTIDFVGVL